MLPRIRFGMVSSQVLIGRYNFLCVVIQIACGGHFDAIGILTFALSLAPLSIVT